MGKGFKITCLNCGNDNIDGTIIIITDSDDCSSTVTYECVECGNTTEEYCH